MHKRFKQILIGVAVMAALAVAFAAYLRPSFIVDLANQLILCF